MNYSLDPLRELEFTFPYDTFSYKIFCSYCNYFSDGRVKHVEDYEYEDIMNDHQCTEYCNNIFCKKKLIIDKKLKSEFYIINEKYFMCFKCMKCNINNQDKFKFRSFWKIPKNSIYKKQSTSSRNLIEIKKSYSYLFEDSWFEYYNSLNLKTQCLEMHQIDYNIYLNLQNLGIV